MNTTVFDPEFEKYYIVYIVALCSVAVAAFGWRVAAACAVTAVVGHATAVLASRMRGERPFRRGAVLWAALPLALPAATPLWALATGAVFGETVVRQLFGGYGRNIVNPLAVAVVFLGVSYPAIITGAETMPGSQPAAGFTRWASDGAACPVLPQCSLASRFLVLDAPVTPGSLSPLLAVAGLGLLWRRRAFHAAFPAGAVAGLALTLTVQSLLGRPTAIPAIDTLVADGGFLIALAAAGLDPYSLARTPAVRLPGGLLFGGLFALLVRVQGAVPAGFSALLLTNLVTPLADACVVARRARQWIVAVGRIT
ncbi:MAG TPA: RnfABCDGE type electron transport complex subunit D [Candidatus Ozemobacteraceae bacterium]|nr:RnfABCDGE type electron transport complex subunit D [Candidatus Ozemobacteraceae bacterium]